MEPSATTAENQIQQENARSRRRFTLRERILLWLITWAGYLFIRTIGPTLRFTMIREEGCITDGWTAPPSIWCFWHRCVIPAGYHFRGRLIAIMISQSFDGEYIARIVKKLGIRAVRGSSSRGGAAALIGMRNELEKGISVAFTSDGPRGPIYVAKPGPIMLAKLTGRSVNCAYIAVKNAWTLNSWDRMIIPRPFSRACAYLSSPIQVPRNATDEQMKALHQRLQETLERCRLRAEEQLAVSS